MLSWFKMDPLKPFMLSHDWAASVLLCSVSSKPQVTSLGKAKLSLRMSF